jgi:hypothetical protein
MQEHEGQNHPANETAGVKRKREGYSIDHHQEKDEE